MFYRESDEMNQNNDSQFKGVPSVVEDCLLFEDRLPDSEVIAVDCVTVRRLVG